MNSDVCMPPTSTETPDVQTSRKTTKQICLCVVEKLNMIFLVFFICYLSWSIPANYGLFTSRQSNISLPKVSTCNSGLMYLIYFALDTRHGFIGTCDKQCYSRKLEISKIQQ
jgi:hypothetical protein